MATVQWRPEVNALTVPQSYWPRCVPRNSIGDEELAAEIAQMHPNFDPEAAKTIMLAERELIARHLINGDQVVQPNAFIFRVSLGGRLNAPDDPLPPAEDILKVQISASRSLTERVQRAVQLERLPAAKKLPLIISAEDTVLKLNDVLNPAGALRLTGSDLFFAQEDSGGECVLEGTRSGRKVQSRFVFLSNAEITFLPDIPAQNEPWNNEYILSVSTHYTENGSLRTGIYERRLRTPLTVTKLSHPNPPETGILTDNAAAPHVKITGGSLSADETARVQVLLEHDGSLSFNLLDMTEGGRAGAAVKVTANGPVTLSGFSGSALSSLNLNVSSFDDLVKMIRSKYSGRLVEVLLLKQGS